MKKFITILAMALLIATPFTAIAGSIVNGNYEGGAAAIDNSSTTSWFGFGDDYGISNSSGQVTGTVDTHADGSWFSYQTGTVAGEQSADASSYAIDLFPFSPTSWAGASASTDGEVGTFGLASGIGGGPDTVTSTVTVTGFVQQENYAGETSSWNGNGQGISAGSYSSADFLASDTDSSSSAFFGIIPAIDVNAISGGASVDGNSFVTIDPYGSHRSMNGTTDASSETHTSGASTYNGIVGGNGSVGGNIGNNGTFAGGSSGFSYTGSYSGSGNAEISADIYNGGNYSTVNISGSSFSTGN